MTMTRFAAVVLSIALLLPFVESTRDHLVPREWNGQQYGCKCYFDDKCWPSQSKWTRLNSTVGGNLRVHIPPESVCHSTFDGPLGSVETYDEEACEELTKSYPGEQWT